MGEKIDIRSEFATARDYDQLAERLRLQLGKVGGIRSSFLYGSYSRGDFIPGWSDLDVMVVMSQRLIRQKTIEQLLKIKRSLTYKHPISLTFKIHTKDELPNYEVADGSIHRFFLKAYAESGSSLTGEPPSELLAPILKCFDIKDCNDFLIKRIYVERHKLRSAATSITNEFPQDFSTHLPRRYIANGDSIGLLVMAAKTIDAVLDVAMYSNGIMGSHTMHKDDICSTFERLSELAIVEKRVPSLANSIRTRWGLFDEKELRDIIQKGYHFVAQVYEELR